MKKFLIVLMVLGLSASAVSAPYSALRSFGLSPAVIEALQTNAQLELCADVKSVMSKTQSASVFSALSDEYMATCQSVDACFVSNIYNNKQVEHSLGSASFVINAAQECKGQMIQNLAPQG